MNNLQPTSPGGPVDQWTTCATTSHTDGLTICQTNVLLQCFPPPCPGWLALAERVTSPRGRGAPPATWCARPPPAHCPAARPRPPAAHAWTDYCSRPAGPSWSDTARLGVLTAPTTHWHTDQTPDTQHNIYQPERIKYFVLFIGASAVRVGVAVALPTILNWWTPAGTNLPRGHHPDTRHVDISPSSRATSGTWLYYVKALDTCRSREAESNAVIGQILCVLYSESAFLESLESSIM